MIWAGASPLHSFSSIPAFHCQRQFQLNAFCAPRTTVKLK